MEALTAVDRPYKKGKTLSEAIKIMSFMKKDQHIDPELFDLFLRSGVYREYAERFTTESARRAVKNLTALAPKTARLERGGVEVEVQVAEVRVGDTVWVSGIPAPADGDESSRYTRLFERLDEVLKTAGATLADVVEIQSFHTNLADSAAFQAHFAKFLEGHKVAFPAGYPAWTAVGTTALPCCPCPLPVPKTDAACAIRAEEGR